MLLRRIAIAAVMALSIAVLHPLPKAHASERIAVIVSSSELPFEETFTGFRRYLEKRGKTVSYDVYRCNGDAAEAAKAVQMAVKGGPRMVFALGSLSVDAALKQAPDLPLVAGLVLRPEIFNKAANATGVTLEFPLDLQFAWMRRMLPDITTIGVIYSPDENKSRVKKAARIARGLGLKLVARQVREPRDVPSALEALSRKAEAMWGLTDNLALSPHLAKYILLFSFRSSIPLIGPSTAWVKAGALYSLDWDYDDMGAQCGEMAAQILEGTRPGNIPPAVPRTVLYSINQKTAQRMRIEIPKTIIKGARKVY